MELEVFLEIGVAEVALDERGVASAWGCIRVERRPRIGDA
jgi:hypothetical protein